MQQQFATMLAMQDRMNTRVHESWPEQRFAWHRALWLECGELIDHYGYKWWKKQTPDMEQVKLEIVDVWHFGMSMLFDGRTIDDIAVALVQELKEGSVKELGVIDATEALATTTLAQRRFSICDFWSLLLAAEMDFDELYSAYVGKNVLNFFRQDNGYQEGTYQKQWLGREDNEHLVEIVAEMDKKSANFAEDLYQLLDQRYRSLSA
ncbi:MAG: dUTP diphosphatase [Pseudomonadales bacterium]